MNAHAGFPVGTGVHMSASRLARAQLQNALRDLPDAPPTPGRDLGQEEAFRLIVANLLMLFDRYHELLARSVLYEVAACARSRPKRLL